MLPGEYTFIVRTAALDLLGLSHSSVKSLSDSSVALSIDLPSPAQAAARLCGPRTPGGAVAGRLMMSGYSTDGARVIAEWRQQTGSGLTARWIDAQIDAQGRFHLCSAPVETDIELRAYSSGGSSEVMRLRVSSAAGFAAADSLAIEPRSTTGMLLGVVLSDINGAPLVDVEVAVPGLSRSTRSDADGRFRLADLPPGDHNLVLRRPGLRQQGLQFHLSLGGIVERKVLMSRIQVVEAVTVTESAAPASFEEHRKLGLGRFLTPEDLEKRTSVRLPDVLRSLPGVSFTRSATTSAVWLAGRGRSLGGPCLSTDELEGSAPIDSLKGRTCVCCAQVYLDAMRLFGGPGQGVVPDLNRFPVSSIQASEFSSGPAQTPARYSTLNSSCGVLVIHTKRE